MFSHNLACTMSGGPSARFKSSLEPVEPPKTQHIHPDVPISALA